MNYQSYKNFQHCYELKNNSSLGGEGSQKGKGQKFFDFRPFTRILNWGKDFQACAKYLLQNILETTGFTSYKKRKNYYAGETRFDPFNPFTVAI